MNIRFHGVPQRHLLLLAMCMVAGWGPASAQTAAEPVVLTAPAPTLPSAYRSALDGYQAYAEDAIADWRNANDEVARVGGWRAYAREAQGTTPAAKPASSTAAQPVPVAEPAKP